MMNAVVDPIDHKSEWLRPVNEVRSMAQAIEC